MHLQVNQTPLNERLVQTITARVDNITNHKVKVSSSNDKFTVQSHTLDASLMSRKNWIKFEFLAASSHTYSWCPDGQWIAYT